MAESVLCHRTISLWPWGTSVCRQVLGIGTIQPHVHSSTRIQNNIKWFQLLLKEKIL